jgi:translation initiation factor IF-1
MTKEELLQFEGLVKEILPDDRVTVEMSPYDLEKGRLIFRHKDERPSTGSRPPVRNQFRRR